jgi:hypothetical protein
LAQTEFFGTADYQVNANYPFWVSGRAGLGQELKNVNRPGQILSADLRVGTLEVAKWDKSIANLNQLLFRPLKRAGNL